MQPKPPNEIEHASLADSGSSPFRWVFADDDCAARACYFGHHAARRSRRDRAIAASTKAPEGSSASAPVFSFSHYLLTVPVDGRPDAEASTRVVKKAALRMSRSLHRRSLPMRTWQRLVSFVFVEDRFALDAGPFVIVDGDTFQ